ncbi:MAG: class I SAM-dependent methyltransferase [Myxococcales bacterium]|jgi:ubiquinone/menaquinone biosynthesis C-methylase UbiE
MPGKTAAERFDETAHNYATSSHHVGGRSLERMLEVAEPTPEMLVLDLAAGTGHTTAAFAPRVKRVVAYDPAPRMLAETEKLLGERQLQNVVIRRGLAEQISFEDETFDLVVSRLAPHHFEGIEKALREMARVTKRGGKVLVSDLAGFEDPEVDEFNHSLEMLHDPTHVGSYTPERWRGIFAQAGLEVFHEEQFFEPPQGLLVSEWCRVAQTPADSVLEIIGRCLEAPTKIRDALGIAKEGDDLRMRARRIELIGGIKK